MSQNEDALSLPPGWGPIVFLAAVAVLCSLGLGLWFRAMLHTTMQETCGQSSQQLAQPIAGPELPGGVAGPPPSREPVTVRIDEALFTEELEAFADRTASEKGLDPEQLPSAKEMVMQMARSGLLPQDKETLDLHEVLEAHLGFLAQQAAGTESWSFQQPGAAAPAHGAGAPTPGVPAGQPPAPPE
jgi:hypothetical protein